MLANDHLLILESVINSPDSKVHGANMGPIRGRQCPGGWAPCWPHGPCYLGQLIVVGLWQLIIELRHVNNTDKNIQTSYTYCV